MNRATKPALTLVILILAVVLVLSLSDDREPGRFRGESLSGKTLRYAELVGVDLHAMDLSGTDLLRADLSHASLVSANLVGANLHGADLTDAKARGATILQLRGKLNAALAAKVSELKRYRSDFLARLSDVLGDRKDIRVVGDRFVLQSEVLFATAKAELGPKGQASIRAVAQSLAEIVKTMPADVDWVLRVDGHTDQRPFQ